MMKKALKIGKRAAIDLAASDLVSVHPLDPSSSLPLVVEPRVPDIRLASWAAERRDWIDDRLHAAGAILLRGFGLSRVEEFEELAAGLCGDLYGEYGDLPRERQGERVYESTPYPPEERILFHNEASHTGTWPMRQVFFSQIAAQEGGETPIADCRRVYASLEPALARRFTELGLLYVRNFIPGIDVDWREFFKTDERSEVEALCSASGIECEWTADGGMKASQKAPAVARHPVTGELLFFNQVQLHHVSFLPQRIRESVEGLFGGRVPRNVFFGDGSPIPQADLDAVSEAYESNAVAFRWQAGDVLAVDNMLVAHSRNTFRGPRKIVVAMGRMFDRRDLAAVGAGA